MKDIVLLIIGFMLTGVVGKRLAQSWQNHAWLLQQRFSGREKEYNDLKDLAAELATLLSTRIYAMSRLNWQVFLLSGNPNAKPDQTAEMNLAYESYRDSVVEWNKKLATYFVRLPILATYSLTIDLEKNIQGALVSIGADLDRSWRKRYWEGSGDRSTYHSINVRLLRLQGISIEYNKKLLNYLTAASKLKCNTPQRKVCT